MLGVTNTGNPHYTLQMLEFAFSFSALSTRIGSARPRGTHGAPETRAEGLRSFGPPGDYYWNSGCQYNAAE